MEIPNLGTFYLKNGIACMNYNQFLKNDVKTVLNQTIKERKLRVKSDLNKENLSSL